MIKRLLLLLAIVLFAKHSGPGGRDGDANGGSSGGRGGSESLAEQEARIQREMDLAWGSVETPQRSDGPDDADDGPKDWKKPDERPSAWDNDDADRKAWDDMTNPGGLTYERENKILHGDLNDSKSGGHFAGTGKPGKKEFPPGWDEQAVIDNVQDTARDPDSVNPRRGRDRGYEAHKQIDGVDVTVVLNVDGSIHSAYPTGGPGVVTNPP